MHTAFVFQSIVLLSAFHEHTLLVPEDKIKPINQWELEPKMEDVRPKDSRYRGKNNNKRNRDKTPKTPEITL